MSDYVHNEVIRFKPSISDIEMRVGHAVEPADLYDACEEIKESMAELFSHKLQPRFSFEYTLDYKRDESVMFLDLILESSYGEDSGDYGVVRLLTKDEMEYASEIFKLIFPNVIFTDDNLRYVDYCYYNCSECDAYFDMSPSDEDSMTAELAVTFNKFKRILSEED